MWRHDLDIFLTKGGTVIPGLVSDMMVYLDPSDDVFEQSLLRQIEPWAVEDLTETETWAIGVWAHTNPPFRRMLSDYLDSHRSPFHANGKSAGDYRFEASFGIQTMVAQVMSSDDWITRDYFARLITCSRSGASSMLQLFLDAGLKDDRETLSRCLNEAAAIGNLEVLHTLLNAGADPVKALPRFLIMSRCVPSFHYVLSTLLNHIRPVNTLASFDPDPLAAVLCSNRALKACPQAPHILFNHGIYNHSNLYGGGGVCISDSHMFHAIRSQSDAINLFLAHGVEANVQIGQLFDILGYYEEDVLGPCSWLTLAVHCGSVTCADILIKYGADVLLPDGSGRNAIQIAQSNLAADHPRDLVKFRDFEECQYAEAAEDNEMLVLLQDALARPLESPSTMPIAVDRGDGTPDYGTKATPQASGKSIDSQGAKNSVAVGSNSGLSFGGIKSFLLTITTGPRVQPLRRTTRRVLHKLLWLSRLSFHEALLMVLGFMVGYGFLLFYEIIAIAIWLGNLPSPPRAIFSTVAISMFVLVCSVIIWC